jgi:hypothetical protein
MKRRLAVATLAALAACSKSPKPITDTTTPQPAAASSGAAVPDTLATVRGTVASITASQLVVTSDSGGSVTIKLAQPLSVFSRKPSSLADVKNNTFVGVTTVKQPDGAEQATEIHIFPEELRGLGEGSRMMAGGSQMTNGNVAPAQPSRMSNGSVTQATGSTMVVQYAGGSTNVTIPPKTPVTAIAATTKPLASGDKVVVIGTRAADGSISSSRVLLSGK